MWADVVWFGHQCWISLFMVCYTKDELKMQFYYFFYLTTFYNVDYCLRLRNTVWIKS